MRRSWLLIFGMIAALAAPATAQIGKRPAVQAGSPEDRALAEINAATDPTQKLALIDKFMADYGKGDMALLACQLYIAQYMANKDYDKVFDYGDKALAVDPDNFDVAVTLARAAKEKGDLAKMFSYGERAGQILTRYKAQPAPVGTEAAAWEQLKANNIASEQDNINYIEYTLYSTAYATEDANAKIGLLERYAAAFPDSAYTSSAEALVAFAYQQAQNYPKMLQTAQALLSKDPNNLDMLLLLADYYSENGQQLDMAEADSKKALDVIAQAKKPEGISDEQWQEQISLQKGLALSSLGEVYITRKNEAAALDAFRSAAPLLKSNPPSYARNQYRLGFALLNLKRNAEAREAFEEAAAIDSPYKKPAEEKLAGLGGPPTKRRPKKEP